MTEVQITAINNACYTMISTGVWMHDNGFPRQNELIYFALSQLDENIVDGYDY